VRLLLAWLLVVVCIAVILTLSSDTFAAPKTSRILTPLLRWLFPDISSRELFQAHVFVRKAAHLTEYAVLGLLAFRALHLSLDVSALRLVLLTLGLVLSVAGIDELRQATLATRTGSVADVAIDFTGGAIGVLAIVGLHRWLGIGAPAREEP
jgi:VanZ family protein